MEETRSPRRVSSDVEEVPNARRPTWPGSTRPSPAQRGRGEHGTDGGHEALVWGLLDHPARSFAAAIFAFLAPERQPDGIARFTAGP